MKRQPNFSPLILQCEKSESKSKAEGKAGGFFALSFTFAFRLPPSALLFYCHLNILSAMRKLITHQASRTETAAQLAATDAPSFITERRESLSAVSGSALMNG